MSRIVSFFVLIAIICVIGFLFYRVIAPFILPLFLAALLVVIFHPLHRRVLTWCKERQRLAALCTTALVLLIVLIPLSFVLAMAAAEGSAVVARLDVAELQGKLAQARDRFGWLQMTDAREIREVEGLLNQLRLAAGESEDLSLYKPSIQKVMNDLDTLQADYKVTSADTAPRFDRLRSTIAEWAGPAAVEDRPGRQQVNAGVNQFHDLKQELLGGSLSAWFKDLANPTELQGRQFLAKVVENIQQFLLSIGGQTTAMVGRFVVGMIIMVVSMFFFLVDGPSMVTTIMRLSPLDDRYEKELLADFENVSRAVVVATLLSAFVQAILGGIGYFAAGFESVILMMLLTGLLAMIPFVGAAAVWVPACLWLYFMDERVLAAVVLAIYGTAVISAVDNVIKPIVLHGRSRLHPLLALLSVLGGVNALGPIGILVGPMVVAFLQTLLNILHRELVQFDSERARSVITGSEA